MKKLCLGTATWGWSVTQAVAASILDEFYASGCRHVDTASNYPINGDPSCLGRAGAFLGEWISAHGVPDLRVTYKVGSVSNEKTPTNDLRASRLADQFAAASELFGNSLHCLMIHWDNRNDPEAIADTCGIVPMLGQNGVEFGLSGIRHPVHYSRALSEYSVPHVNVQIRHNPMESTATDYADLSSVQRKYWAYGIAVGGLKLSMDRQSPASYSYISGRQKSHQQIRDSALGVALRNIVVEHPLVNNFYELAMVYAETSECLTGYLVAPSNTAQMQEISGFRKAYGAAKKSLPPINWPRIAGE